MQEIFYIMLGIPLIIFMLLVAPIWLVLHYRTRRQLNQGLDQEDVHQLEHLAQTAEEMSERIRTLERILDHESPGWKERQQSS